ncbi:MAG: tetratricopeptide repeat protein [bacterium]
MKEKVKRYIKENYGKCSVNEVAQKFNVSHRAVEEYIINEIHVEEEKEREKTSQSPPEKNNGLIWANRTLITLILVAFAILIVALTVSQLSNNDLWQHLKNGQMILQTHKFQYTDPYSCNAAGKPWINEAWFSGVVFYIVYSLIGVNGIIYLKTLVILLMAALVLLNCYKLKTKFLLFIPLTVFMIFNVGVRFLARTEMFSYFFIAAFILILMQYKYRRPNWRILFLLPILQIFWSNMHGSFIVGLFIIAIFTIGETARLLFNRFVTSWQRDLLTWERLKPLYIIFSLTFLACLVNPYGFRLFIQPFYVVFHKSEYIKTIYEWQSPFESKTFYTSYAFKYYVVWMHLLGLSFFLNIKKFNPTNLILSLSFYLMAVFFMTAESHRDLKLFIIFIGLFFLINIERLDLTNFILSLFFFIMAAQMHRNITIFTIATCPIIALNFQQAGNDYIEITDQKFKQLIDAGGGIVLLLILIPLIRISFKNGYIYRKNSSKPFGLGVAANMPIDATKYIQANHIKGCCFNSYTYGTYLIFHCFPDVRVTMDSRAEHVYGEEFYNRHQRALFDVNTFKGILEEFNIEFILLKYQGGDYLVNHCEYLKESGEWAMVYFDDSCFLYIRRLPEYSKLIARDEYKYIHPLLTLRESRVSKEEIDEYINESERNLASNPGYFFPHLMLLNLYSAKNRWDRAIEHGEFLISRGHKNFSIFLVMGLAYENLKEFDKAEDMYIKAMALNPNSREASKAIERIEILKKRELPSDT